MRNDLYASIYVKSVSPFLLTQHVDAANCTLYDWHIGKIATLVQ